jgi:hypothetical protein
MHLAEVAVPGWENSPFPETNCEGLDFASWTVDLSGLIRRFS